MNTPDAPDSSAEKGKDAGSSGGSSSYLPPKLREKLMAGEGGGGSGGGDDWKPKPQSPLPLIITLVIIVAVAGGLFFMIQRGAESKRKAQAQAHADSLAAMAAAESTMAAAQMDSLRAAAAAESTAALAQKAAALTAAKAGGPFGIQAGTYIDEDRANSEKTRLASSSGLAARVMSATEGGATVYQVVLGSFETRVEAEKKGLDLMGRGVLNQALAVSLKKK